MLLKKTKGVFVDEMEEVQKEQRRKTRLQMRKISLIQLRVDQLEDDGEKIEVDLKHAEENVNGKVGHR